MHSRPCALSGHLAHKPLSSPRVTQKAPETLLKPTLEAVPRLSRSEQGGALWAVSWEPGSPSQDRLCRRPSRRRGLDDRWPPHPRATRGCHHRSGLELGQGLPLWSKSGQRLSAGHQHRLAIPPGSTCASPDRAQRKW